VEEHREIPFAAELQEAIEEALAEGRGDFDLALSAAVFVPRYLAWTGVAGPSATGAVVTTNTLFDVGSVAKTFEAALVLILAKEGVLSLDSPISNWLPPLQNVDPSITLRQLLNHTSGVFNVFEHPNFPWVGADVDHARVWGMDEVFSHFVLEPYGAPGSVQHYSSTNYRLVTAILEAATGQSVPELMEDRILLPLGLHHTHMTMGAWPPGRFDVAHPMVDMDLDGVLDDLTGRSRSWVATLTHPVLFSTPADLVRWTTALFHDREVLSPTALEAMLTFPDTPELDPDGDRYGLGVVGFSERLGVQVIGHAGSALGYSAAALYLPEYGAALAWAINTGESPADLAATLMGRTWTSLLAVLRTELTP
jgi:D-alanyl-D-alanine carboxypeptidase